LIHFWTSWSVPERYGKYASPETLRDLLDGWDPDRQPDRFLTGYGHSLLELYARLKARGVPVTIGQRPPAESCAIVASLEELTHWRNRLAPGQATRLSLAAARCPAVVVIRGDLPLGIGVPRYVRTEVMPTEASITDRRRQTTMPMLPQRGLIRRTPDRGGRIDRLALKCFTHNMPDFVRSPQFEGQLNEIGIDLRIDTEVDQPSRWHDFSDVDAALCVRRFLPGRDTDEDYLRKPATKLVNAWCAGVVPIVAPEAGYLELVADGKDAIVAGDARSIVSALKQLRGDQQRVLRLIAAGQAKAGRWSTKRVLDEWQQLLGSDLPRSTRAQPLASAARHAPTMVLEGLRARLAPDWHQRPRPPAPVREVTDRPPR
jgi:hypothetical protein